jgi:hypothetical protein
MSTIASPPSLRSALLYQRDPFAHQFDSEAEEVGSIHSEDLEGRAADRGPSRDSSRFELKVPGPEVSTRMNRRTSSPEAGSSPAIFGPL